MGAVSVPTSDQWSGHTGYIASGRGSRPTTTANGCPFCAGGLEAGNPYSVPYAFANRWAAIAPGFCEVVVHGGDHERDFADLTTREVRRVVDLWAERTECLAARADVACVLVFENRGAEAGATVGHPHSQVFGFGTVPAMLAAASGPCPGCSPASPTLAVARTGGWRAEVPTAAPAPYSLRLVPDQHVHTLCELSENDRSELAIALKSGVRCLDALFAAPMPYHLWVRQSHRDDGHLYVMIAGLRRSAVAMKIPGAAEVATGMFFNPVAPIAAARELRSAGATGVCDV